VLKTSKNRSNQHIQFL